jgi:hypothetical protein
MYSTRARRLSPVHSPWMRTSSSRTYEEAMEEVKRDAKQAHRKQKEKARRTRHQGTTQMDPSEWRPTKL